MPIERGIEGAMLLRRFTTILSTDVKWGRLAAIAAGAAFLAVVTSSGTLSFLPLVVFSIGGVVIDRIAPKRPYWNALVYGLLGVLFYALLVNLNIVGRGQPLPPTAEMLEEVLSIAIVILPQSLIGAWIGVTIRRVSRFSRENKGQGGGTAPQPEASAEKEKGRKGARPAPQAPPARRQGKR
jgi:hypothetical protein